MGLNNYTGIEWQYGDDRALHRRDAPRRRKVPRGEQWKVQDVRDVTLYSLYIGALIRRAAVAL